VLPSFVVVFIAASVRREYDGVMTLQPNEWTQRRGSRKLAIFLQSPRRLIMSIVLGALLAAATATQADCRVCKIPMSVGMERSEVEKKVAQALGKESRYTPYNDNLQGGVVAYADGRWILRVSYGPGAVAPWVVNANGVAEHYAPVESKVIKYELIQAKKR
jgi:hypothetical protein